MPHIDFFAHAFTRRYMDELDANGIQHHPTPPSRILWDFDYRVSVMDEFAPGDTSVLTMMSPDLESLVPPDLAVKLARLGNDELAEAVSRYPRHFAAAAASLPLDSPAEAARECRRAIEELGLKGIQISTNCRGEYPDSERYWPLYEMLAAYDLPVWLHPAFAPGPLRNPFDVELIFGWPMDTTMAMFRLAKSEVFDRWPSLKFITHHAGAFIPAFYPRLKAQYFDNPPYLAEPVPEEIRPRCENLRRFYADTAVYGACADTLDLSCRFFGADHLLYGTDFPSMTPEELPNTIRSVERMNVSAADRRLIFSDNARRLLKLP